MTFRTDPENLTVKELKSILQENGIILPKGNKKKIVYVNLYKENLLTKTEQETIDIFHDIKDIQKESLLLDFDARLNESIQEIYRARDEAITHLSRRLALELSMLPSEARNLTVAEARQRLPHLKI